MGGSALLYELGHRIRAMRSPGRHHLAVRRWKRVSESHGELRWWYRPLRLPRETPQRCRAEAKRAVLWAMAGGVRGRAAWLRERLSVVRAEVPTLRRLRFGMQRLARSMSVPAVVATDAQTRAAALAGTDVRICKAYWKVVAHEAQAGELAYEWAARAIPGLGSGCRPTPHTVAELVQHACAASPPAPPDARWSNYVCALPHPAPHELLVAEDKDPSSGVLVEALPQAIRCWHYALQDGSWEQTSLSPGQLATVYRDSHRTLRLGPAVESVPLREWEKGMPFMWMSIKQSAGPPARRHVQKRATPAFAGSVLGARISRETHLPRGRRVGRAWRVALLHVSAGDSMKSLATAARQVRESARRLGPGSGSCDRCSAREPRGRRVGDV